VQPVAILIHRIGPYHRARVNAAAARFPAVAVELSSTDTTYAWDAVATPELERITVFQDVDVDTVSGSVLAERIGQALRMLKPRAVAIPGWSAPAALAALQWCVNSGTPAVLMSESQSDDFARSWWKEVLKRRLVSLFSSGLVGGSPHVAYLTTLGMPGNRVFTGYDVIDNDYFAAGAASARADAVSLRKRLGLPERFILASSRFIEKKNLGRLLDAFARFRTLASGTDWKLVLLGDGPLKPEILATASRLQLGGDLLLPGFQQYEALPTYYGLASAFIHASTVEQWGLVVNEAMAAGLPVLVSNRCGCAMDLVREGRNGFRFDPLDTEGLAGLMARVAADEGERLQMGETSRRIIAEWPTARFAAGLEAAVACAAPVRRAGLADAALTRLLMERAGF